jgi:hypothetical protein
MHLMVFESDFIFSKLECHKREVELLLSSALTVFILLWLSKVGMRIKWQVVFKRFVCFCSKFHQIARLQMLSLFAIHIAGMIYLTLVSLKLLLCLFVIPDLAGFFFCFSAS